MRCSLKIVKKTLKRNFSYFKVVESYQCWVHPKSSLAVLVTVSSQAGSICNHVNDILSLVDSIAEFVHFKQVSKFDIPVRRTP